MGRADIEVPNRGVDWSSRPRRACYPWGNFSVTSSPQQWGHEGSLGQAFAPGSSAFKDPVRPAFSLALNGGVLTHLSRPLGPLDTFSRGCRPSRTAHLPVSPSGLVTQPRKAGVTLTPITRPEACASTAPSYSLQPQPRHNDRLQ